MPADSQPLKVTGKVGDKDYAFQIEAAEWFNFLYLKEEIQLSEEEIADKELLRHYPAIGLIYDMAISSYETASKRLDIVNGRLESLLVFIVTANGVVIGAAVKNVTSYQRWEFFLTMLVLVITLTYGVIQRICGKLIVLNPQNYFKDPATNSDNDKWTFLREFGFKNNFIHKAGGDFTANFKVINDKWWASIYISILFAIEVFFICLWLIRIS